MKTTRSIVPALVVLTVLVGAALIIGIVGRGEQGKQEAPLPLVDNGPNAGLSNKELISVAITNMKALKSYHFEFTGGMPAMDVRMSSNLSIIADVQLHGNGARWTVRDEGGGISGGVGGMNYDVGAGIDGIRATGGHWYESYDGGKTWMIPTTDTVLSFLLLWLDCRWGDLFEEVEQTGDPTICEALARYVNFNDGTPRLEQIDGVVTRHMVGVYGNRQEQAGGQATTVDIWVSTGITPTLRQMRVVGSNPIYQNIVEEVNEVAFSPDSKMLAAAHGWTQDSTIRLYDLNSPGAPQRKLTNGMHYFRSVDFSPDGTLIAATSLIPVDHGPMGVYIWDLTKENPLPITWTASTPADVSYIAFQPKGTLLAAGSSEGIYLLNPRDLKATPTVLPVPKGLNPQAIAFSRDGQTLALGTYVEDDSTGDCLIYDMRYPGKAPVHLRNKDAGDDVALSPDGQLLAWAGLGQAWNGTGYLSVWDVSKPQAPLVTLPGKVGDNGAAAFSPDGKFLAALGEDSLVELWDVNLLRDPTAAHTPAVKLGGIEATTTDIAFSPDGKRLAVSTDDGSVLVWTMDDVLNGKRSGASKPQIFKEERVLIDKPFTLTWTWSRFNEDFGYIKPPRSDTIKQP